MKPNKKESKPAQVEKKAQLAAKPVNKPQQKPNQANAPANNNKPLQQEKNGEVKSEPKKEELKYIRTTQLKNLVPIPDQDFEQNKISFIVDHQGNVGSFYTYQAITYDLAVHLVELQLKKITEDELQEKLRKVFVGALGGGRVLAILCEGLVNLRTIFTQPWFNVDKLFNYKNIMDEAWLKSTLLKPEEDVDQFGGKGHWLPRPAFKLVIVVKDSQHSLEEIVNGIGLDSKYFNFSLIEQ